MSDQSVMDRIDVTQSRRFYWWSTDSYPIPRRAIIENSANMHMIPASEDVKDRLFSVRRGDLISLRGYLVNVSADGFSWRTSLTRKDAGAGACEVVWVESVSIYEADPVGVSFGSR